MSVGLKWFKFSPAAWMMGRIQRQSESCQAAFVRLMCKYWHSECVFSIEESELECGEKNHNSLVKNKIITIKGDFISIEFLDEQFAELKAVKSQNSLAGKASAAKRKALKSVEQNSTTVEQVINERSTDKIRIDKIRIDNNLEPELDKPTQAKSTSFEDRCKKFIDKFNSLRVINGKPSQFRVTDKIRTKLKARLQDYKPEEIIQAIQKAVKDPYHKETNFKYITPEFILREDKLEMFLNRDTSSSNVTVYSGPQKSIIDHKSSNL